jgi:RNA polymerase sigma-32 factor
VLGSATPNDPLPSTEPVETSEMAEEKDLLPVVVRGSSDLTLYVREMKRFPVLSRKDEQELAKRWHDERDPEAFRQLVLANLRFVLKIANEYRRYGFRVQDLIQEGNIGLIKAVINFNPYRGYRLISYAVWWIRAQIHDHILRNWSMVKIGTTQLQRKLFYKLQNAQSVLKDKIKDEASDADRDQMAVDAIAKALGTDRETVTAFRARMQRRDLSIEAPVSEDGSVTVGDRLSAEVVDQSDVVEAAEALTSLKLVLDDVREKLDAREIDILENRILSESPETLDSIGVRYGVSKERIRQVEKRVREKIVAAGRRHFTESGRLLPPPG